MTADAVKSCMLYIVCLCTSCIAHHEFCDRWTRRSYRDHLLQHADYIVELAVHDVLVNLKGFCIVPSPSVRLLTFQHGCVQAPAPQAWAQYLAGQVTPLPVTPDLPHSKSFMFPVVVMLNQAI